ncbi:MAG: hypothetical protein HQM00_13170 [Magnetococcales bacterium]|nr:hypothetical protein [Magnetococcales bacterium]
MSLLLDEAEEDAFTELFNISFGMTAATLSEMVDAEIELSVPCFSMLTEGSLVDTIREMYGSAVGLVGMRYRFVFSEDHAIPGMAGLLIRAADLGHFLDALHGGPVPEAYAEQVATDSMQLTGEVLLYTCASSLSLLFASEIDGEKPVFFQGDPGVLSDYLSLSESHDPARSLLMLRVDFSLKGKGVSGSLLTWMDGEGLPLLKTEIDHFIAVHMA